MKCSAEWSPGTSVIWSCEPNALFPPLIGPSFPKKSDDTDQCLLNSQALLKQATPVDLNISLFSDSVRLWRYPRKARIKQENRGVILKPLSRKGGESTPTSSFQFGWSSPWKAETRSQIQEGHLYLSKDQNVFFFSYLHLRYILGAKGTWSVRRKERLTPQCKSGILSGQLDMKDRRHFLLSDFS